MNEKGTISVHTEHIFPIIKKFLYSDQDIFLRELVANGIDAVQKLKKLASMGFYEGPIDHLSVEVIVEAEAKKIIIKDNGIGMTADEVKQYINQIAFSGVTAFVEKYKEQMEQHALIGCFGLGFYSAFMVAKRVEIITKSYQQAAEAAHWICDGTTDFELSSCEKATIGTEVILHLSQEAEEFLKKERIQAILEKHCRFLPIPILLDGNSINPTPPLWIKNPSELKEEDYLSFYKTLYPFAADPLFWIHLNMDYPFTLTGILYFPKAASYFEQKETIQLYARQVFITSDVKEVIPGFLHLLHGVIDSPDIPLNVSRSALQADRNVKKISSYIAKKVAEKLGALCQQDRKAYEAKWKDISLFVKYGMLTDEKFDKAVREIVLLQNVAGTYYTIAEYKEKVSCDQTDKHNDVIFLYTTNPQKQAVYLQSVAQKGYDVLLLNSEIDTNFINFGEYRFDKIKFKRVDTASIHELIEKEETVAYLLEESERKDLQSIYEDSIGKEQTTWSVLAMLPEELPVTFVTSELMKRMEQFSKKEETRKEALHSMQLAINGNHPLAKKILHTTDSAKRKELATAAYQLALLSQGLLEGSLLTEFIKHAIDRLLAQ
ncbi:molecular chaperone HtpG [Candidatus Cardinium hertigii]|uniref:Chaperone protein HtpG n=1 Tax=Candidatus Cardinium hertigii TaxID=247481 RepID=A0A2Z3LHJ7_9BACT|nr:molecular chaperone HtpG [Candidatus Cardinium hertigii]AWN81914.1 Chaperone protein HtpG [Candidatus Cardinium hertigii]